MLFSVVEGTMPLRRSAQAAILEPRESDTHEETRPASLKRAGNEREDEVEPTKSPAQLAEEGKPELSARSTVAEPGRICRHTRPAEEERENRDGEKMYTNLKITKSRCGGKDIVPKFGADINW